jgi:hypothetical protein
MIRVITNSNGSGDWIVVESNARNGMEILHEGYCITAMNLVAILENLGVQAELVELTDSEMKEGAY